MGNKHGKKQHKRSRARNDIFENVVFCEKVYFIIEIYLLMKYFVKYTRETKKV